MGEFLLPDALVPGDCIRVIAPSSPFDHELFHAGISWLAERYHVEVAPGTLARDGFLAGSDEARSAALDAALRDVSVKAVVAARGGYGAVRIAHRADWAALRRAPKWLVGFSDVTALHLQAQRFGVCSLHADNAAGLGRADESARAAWRAALEAPAAPRALERLETWRAGSAEGPLCGGNLTVLFTAQASGRLALPDGAILALEDVTEASYRVDRMLSALLLSRALDRVAGIVVGDFTECPAGPHGVPVEAVLRERLAQLGVPVLGGLAFGHGSTNTPLPFGIRAQIDTRAGRLVIGGAAP